MKHSHPPSKPALARCVLPAVFIMLAGLTFPGLSAAQNLQLHEDLRHSTDPARNPHNFPTLYFEYFKSQDRGDSITGPAKPPHFYVRPGSFLFKAEADLLGASNNIGKFYVQVTQSFRCWKPKIYVSLQYSGGLGVTEPKQYSYYINNTYSLGLEIPFRWQGAWFSSVLYDRYVPYPKPGNDLLYTLYWWRGYFHYKVEFAGDFSIWTENKDHGDAGTAGMRGRRFYFIAEPQVWYNIDKCMSVGSRINMYYHVNSPDNVLEAYPTVAVKFKF